MTEKSHFKWHGYDIASDRRDVLVNGKKDYDVFCWCREMNITAEIHLKADGKSIWRVPNEKDRSLFILRWAE